MSVRILSQANSPCERTAAAEMSTGIANIVNRKPGTRLLRKSMKNSLIMEAIAGSLSLGTSLEV